MTVRQIPTLIILTVLSSTIGAASERDAGLFHCDFEAEWDQNFDLTPDGWTRRRGADWPVYISCQIESDPHDAGNRCLVMRLDGGAVALLSPPVPVSAMFTYLAVCKYKTEGLLYDRPRIAIHFLKSPNQVAEGIGEAIGQLSSESVLGTADVPQWTELRIEPAIPPQDAACAVIGIYLGPHRDAESFDLTGAAFFDDIRIARQPRVHLHTSRPDSLHMDPDDVEVHFDVSGAAGDDPTVNLELRDAYGRVVAVTEMALTAEATAAHVRSEVSGEEKNPPGLGMLLTGTPPQENFFRGSAKWKPPIPSYGYFTVHADFIQSGKQSLQREAGFAVVQAKKTLEKGEFAWTLPQGGGPIALTALPRILKQAGINCVKLPVWLEAEDDARLLEIAWFVERLISDNIFTVGILDQPPVSLGEHVSDTARPSAAEIFVNESTLWYPSLEPILTRLLRIRWWQLGSDDDWSFQGLKDLSAIINQTRAPLNRFGHDLRIGIGWNWTTEPPRAGARTVNFMALTATPSLTADELPTYLTRMESSATERWVAMSPLPRSNYSFETRLRDLAERIISAKRYGATRIVLPQPFDAEVGVMRPDGQPGEMFVPWRNIAYELAGREYAGNLLLTHGSENHLLSQGDQMTMAIWNREATQETVYLGNDISVYDVWGNKMETATADGRAEIEVGPVPVFIKDLDSSLVRWQQSLKFAKANVPNVRGRSVWNKLVWDNPFDRGIQGTIHLNVPLNWNVSPRQIEFRQAAGEQSDEPIEFRLPFETSTGRQDINLGIELTARGKYHLQLQRSFEIGESDVYLKIDNYVDHHGDLVVEQRFVNTTDDVVDFDCYLEAPRRQPVKQSVRRLGREIDEVVYRLPYGKQLVGETLRLSAEERNGPRVLIHYFTPE